MDAVKRGLLNTRVIVNAGYNERGTYLSGQECKAIVRNIDNAILMIDRLDEILNDAHVAMDLNVELNTLLQRKNRELMKCHDELQTKLSDLLEKKDVCGRKIRRSQDYKDAVFAAKSVLHSYFKFHNEDGE